jgi:ABC-type polar amino acid transport system ATPase subunit
MMSLSQLAQPAVAGVVAEPCQTLIELSGVTKRFGDRLILDDISLSINRGETVAIIGPSGGGKSTLLRCINGLNHWQAGTVRVEQHQLAAEGNTRAAGDAKRQIRQLVGMIFQDFQLFPHLSVLENVALAPVHVLGSSRHAATDQAQSLLARVGLADRAAAYPEQLSGGQKQRVAIARALAMQPRALLCDEITSALDPELKHEVLEVLEDLKRDGMTLLMVTHEIGFARRVADRVLVLAGGKIVEDGPPAQVIDQPQTERTRQFLSRVLG